MSGVARYFTRGRDHRLRKPLEDSDIFQSQATFDLFLLKGEVKSRGAWHNALPLNYIPAKRKVSYRFVMPLPNAKYTETT